jgi:hypothetical protein
MAPLPRQAGRKTQDEKSFGVHGAVGGSCLLLCRRDEDVGLDPVGAGQLEPAMTLPSIGTEYFPLLFRRGSSEACRMSTMPKNICTFLQTTDL